MPTIALGRVRLHYEEQGAGTPILGIHGSPSSAVLWEDAGRELARHGRCILYEHVDDALGLLDELAARPAVVIGRSTGGLVALALALREPGAVLGVALLEPALFTVDADAAAWASGLRDRMLAVAEDDPGSAARTVVVDALGADVWASWPTELRHLLDGTSPALVAEARGRGLDLSAEPLTVLPADLAAFSGPTLLVSGADSPAPLRAVVARLAETMPDATSVVVPGGHLIDPAHPEVLAFVDRLTV